MLVKNKEGKAEGRAGVQVDNTHEASVLREYPSHETFFSLRNSLSTWQCGSWSDRVSQCPVVPPNLSLETSLSSHLTLLGHVWFLEQQHQHQVGTF